MKVTLVSEVYYGVGYPGYNKKYRIEDEAGEWVEVSGPNTNTPTWDYSANFGAHEVFKNSTEAWNYAIAHA